MNWERIKKVTERVEEEAEKELDDHTINIIKDSHLTVLATNTVIEDGQNKKRQVEYREGSDPDKIYLIELEKFGTRGTYKSEKRDKIAEI